MYQCSEADVARSSNSFVKSNSSDRRRPSALAEGCRRNAGENSPQYTLKSLSEYQRTVSARPMSQDFSCHHPSAKSFEQSMKCLRSLKALLLTCLTVVSGSRSRSRDRRNDLRRNDHVTDDRRRVRYPRCAQSRREADERSSRKQNGHDEILKRCSTTPTNGWFAQRPLVVANKLTYVL